MIDAGNFHKLAEFHHREADRLQGEFDLLGDQFEKDGIVRSVLRVRIAQENLLANEAEIAFDTYKRLAEVVKQWPGE